MVWWLPDARRTNLLLTLVNFSLQNATDSKNVFFRVSSWGFWWFPSYNFTRLLPLLKISWFHEEIINFKLGCYWTSWILKLIKIMNFVCYISWVLFFSISDLKDYQLNWNWISPKQDYLCSKDNLPLLINSFFFSWKCYFHCHITKTKKRFFLIVFSHLTKSG